MNKEELVRTIADKTSVSQKETTKILDALTFSIMEAVAEGDKVTLIGFGSFEARDRQERQARNPRTGEPITIPATKVPAFSSGKVFKEKVSPPTVQKDEETQVTKANSQSPPPSPPPSKSKSKSKSK
jgi:DNA-binding protein HU-beta